MKSEPEWLSTNFAPEMIREMPVTVKDKFAGEIKGHLEVENDNGKGQLVVSAHYDSSPFPDEPRPAKFYLTQEQLDVFLDKGAMCVLNVPATVRTLPV